MNTYTKERLEQVKEREPWMYNYTLVNELCYATETCLYMRILDASEETMEELERNKKELWQMVLHAMMPFDT